MVKKRLNHQYKLAQIIHRGMCTGNPVQIILKDIRVELVHT